MAYLPIEEMLRQGDSIYKLVILASRRALEIAGGSPPLVHSNSKKASTIALEEIMQKKVRYKEAKKETK